jgi:hypothetical protein
VRESLGPGQRPKQEGLSYSLGFILSTGEFQQQSVVVRSVLLNHDSRPSFIHSFAPSWTHTEHAGCCGRV